MICGSLDPKGLPFQGGLFFVSDSGQAHQFLQTEQGLIEIVVHNHGIKLRLRRQFFPGSGQTPLNRLLAVGAATTDSALKLLKAGGSEKNLKTLRKTATNLTRALEFNLKQDRSPCCQALLHWTARCSVGVPSKLSPFQQSAIRNQSIKPLRAVEEITDAVLLSCTGQARCGRNGKPDLRVTCQQHLHQSPFANPTWTGDHRESTLTVIHL